MSELGVVAPAIQEYIKSIKEKLEQANLEESEIKKISNNLDNLIKKAPEITPEEKKQEAPKKPKKLENVLKGIEAKIGEDLSKYDTLYITTMAVDAVLSEDLVKKMGQKGHNKYLMLGQFLMNEVNGKSYVNLNPELILNDYLEPAREAVESDEVKEAIQAARMIYASQVAKIILNEPGKIKNDNWNNNASEVLKALTKPGVEKALKKQLNGYGKNLKGFDLYFSVYLREKGLPVEKVSETMSEVKNIKQGANAFSLMEVEEDEPIN